MFTIKSCGYKFAVIGGDARFLVAAARFHDEGHTVALYGFTDEHLSADPVVDMGCCSASTAKPREIIQNTADGVCFDCGEVCKSPDEALEDCDTVILPLPSTKDGVHISMPLGSERLTFDRLIEIMQRNGVRRVCGGKLPETFAERCNSCGISVFDYYKAEAFALANAVPTAEGALEIVMRELPITVNGSNMLVIGNGRIGKELSRILSALGAKVTVSARREADLQMIAESRLVPAETGKLHLLLADTRFDAVFNTVPHRVLGERELSVMSKGTLIVDLASNPGGVDVGAADRSCHRVIWALSLPGKVAPVTSGCIIANTVLSHMDELGEKG